MSANLTLRVVEDLDGDMFGTQAVIGVAPAAGRSVILDGVDDFLTNGDTGTGVSSAQSGWQFMARMRGLSSPAGDVYIFNETSAQVLSLKIVSGGSFGVLVGAAIGNGFDGPGGTVTVPAADVIVLVRSDPANTAVSLEVWDLAGANHAGSQNTGATATATNFQNRNITIGAINSGGGNYLAAHVDKMLFKTVAGTFNAAAPDVLGTTGDIFNWTFDADNGVDSTGHANLTLNGSPAFENTP